MLRSAAETGSLRDRVDRKRDPAQAGRSSGGAARHGETPFGLGRRPHGLPVDSAPKSAEPGSSTAESASPPTTSGSKEVFDEVGDVRPALRVVGGVDRRVAHISSFFGMGTDLFERLGLPASFD